jgi:outer membrane receptor protein involved in Fe transport
LCATTILAGLASPLAALAADPPAPVQVSSTAPASSTADTSQGAAVGLSEVIVTATRTAESVQRVPISMQAITAETLDQRQVVGLSDLITLLPSVSWAGLGPGRETLYFRGIVPAGGAYASVGFYLDDIPITGTGSPDIQPYDLQRVEALSGPQGTLYGAGSLSGTVRLITNKPKLDVFEGGYDVEANKYGKGAAGDQVEAFVNIPVANNLAVRLVGYDRNDGGFINNTPNDGKFNDGTSSTITLGGDPSHTYTLNNASIAQNSYNPIHEVGGRFEALWQVTPDWSILPEIMAQKQIADGYFGYDPRVGDLDVHDYSPTRQDDEWYQAELSIHGHIADWDVVSATGYFNRKTILLNDYTYYTVTYSRFGPGYENYLQFFDKNGCTGSGATLKCTTLINPTQYYHADTDRQKFTQEIRVTTPKSWPFDVTIGGFYQLQKQENNSYYAIHGLDQIEGYTEAGGDETNPAGFGIPVQDGGTMVLGSPAVKEDGFYIVETDQTFHDEAVFAEGHYEILKNLTLTGGIRYFWTDSETVGFSGVAGSAENKTTSLYVPTGTYGCPLPLPAARLQCLNSNFAAKDEVGRYVEQGETHKAALTWQITPSKMIYFNYSTGFRPGGFNRPLRIRNIGVATVDPYKSETLTNYELGFKTTWNNIFRFNTALYLENWDNIQYGVVVSGTQGAGITGNAGRARIYGVEYDGDLKLGKFTLSTSGAYNDARLDGNFCNFAFNPTTLTISQLSSCTLGQFVAGSSPPTPQVAAANGTRLPRQPLFKGNTSFRYDTTLGPFGAYLQSAVNYQTNATQDLNTYYNELLGDTPGFASVDFSGGLHRGNKTVDLFITNAFDERGELTKNTFCSITFCSNSSRTFTIRPQFFGIKFGERF